jgi:hypothetical protein
MPERKQPCQWEMTRKSITLVNNVTGNMYTSYVGKGSNASAEEFMVR